MFLIGCCHKKYNDVFFKVTPLFYTIMLYLTLCACTLDNNSQLPMSDIKTLTSSQRSVKHCIEYDVDTYNALKKHKLVVVLEVSRYQPSAKNAGMQVAIIDAKSNISINVNRPAIYPNNVFDVRNGDEPMRFNIPLTNHVNMIGHSKSCFEVSFDEIDDSGGRMDIKLFLRKSSDSQLN